MTDPYKVLGVSPSATDEQIKAAFLDLTEKYSPVNYQGNPLADLATDKIEALNAAYDQIMAERRVGRTDASGAYSTANKAADGYSPYTGNNPGYSGNTGYNGPNSSTYEQIRIYIAQSNSAAAESMLLSIPVGQRDAEWYYLMGRTSEAKGWLNDTYDYYSKACSMNPSNSEYRSVFDSFASRIVGNSGSKQNTSKSQHDKSQQDNSQQDNTNYGGYYSSTPCGCNTCDICSCLLCTDCCAECMGGDLISCC